MPQPNGLPQYEVIAPPTSQETGAYLSSCAEHGEEAVLTVMNLADGNVENLAVHISSLWPQGGLDRFIVIGTLACAPNIESLASVSSIVNIDTAHMGSRERARLSYATRGPNLRIVRAAEHASQ